MKLNGKKMVIDTERPSVAAALAKLVEACSQRRFEIGSYLAHDDKDGGRTEYQFVRILQTNGTHRAYLINTETGVARNSRKVVLVEGAHDEYPGFVTEIPAEKDKFIDPENSGAYLDC